MEDSELASCNARGLIPGPSETLEQFKKRVEFCLSLKNEVKGMLPPDAQQFELEEEKALLAKALALSKNCWEIAPDWVPLFFSNSGLRCWHGGAAWIFQTDEKAPLGAFLQLRKELYHKESCLGLYQRDELIAHEFAHVGRMAFDEKRYEELFAYRASPRGFARYVGPILQSASESKLFIYLLVTLMMMDLFFLFQGARDLYFNLMWLKILPLALILLGFIRLQKRQRTLCKCEKKLEQIFGKKAPAVAYRLTDQEIELFAQSSAEEIRKYSSEEVSLRWQVIRLFT